MEQLSKVLLIVGGLNWGLVGVGNLMGSSWNIVSMVLGNWPILLSVVYVLVGAAAVYELYGLATKKGM